MDYRNGSLSIFPNPLHARRIFLPEFSLYSLWFSWFKTSS
jgi:hypothetical protein